MARKKVSDIDKKILQAREQLQALYEERKEVVKEQAQFRRECNQDSYALIGSLLVNVTGLQWNEINVERLARKLSKPGFIEDISGKPVEVTKATFTHFKKQIASTKKDNAPKASQTEAHADEMAVLDNANEVEVIEEAETGREEQPNIEDTSDSEPQSTSRLSFLNRG